VLSSGIVYTPDGTLVDIDMVTVTVDDNHGGTDTVHFVFNVTGGGPNITLTGTSGKDIIYSTGYNDTLTGSGGADRFVFTSIGGNDTITDFDFSRDRVDIASSEFTSVANMLANHTANVSGNAVITDAGGHTITFQGVTTATLQAHASDFHLV